MLVSYLHCITRSVVKGKRGSGGERKDGRTRCSKSSRGTCLRCAQDITVASD